MRRALFALLLVLGCEPSVQSPPDSPLTVIESAPPIQPAAAAPSPPAPAPVTPVLVTAEGRAMGTHIQLTSFTSEAFDEPALKSRFDKALAEIRRLEALMTTWREESEISRINAAAGVSAVTVSPETLAVIEKSVWMSEHSEGVFDITFEAMHGLWKFDQDLEEKVPARAAVERARKL